jgi:hypothetical protein
MEEIERAKNFDLALAEKSPSKRLVFQLRYLTEVCSLSMVVVQNELQRIVPSFSKREEEGN